MNLRRTLWGSWTQKTFCPISRRPDSSLHGLCWVSNGRLKQLTIKGGTAKKSAETRFTGPQKLIKMRSLSAWDPAHALNSVKLLSRVWLFVTPWIAAHQASLFSTNSRSLPKLMPIELVMPSSHLIFCRPLLLLPSIPPSIRVFSSESTLRMRWPKYWSFSFSISPSNEHPELISFRMDWLDLLAVQGTLKSLIQHHSSKASIFQHWAFFTVPLSHPYMTIGKTLALTSWTLLAK